MTRHRPSTLARRTHFGRSASAVSEIVGNLLLLAVTVVAASGFTLIILSLPPPTTSATAVVASYVLPTATDRLVIEHRGGPSVPLGELHVTLDVGGTVTSAIVGDRLAAGDPKWSVLAVSGTLKTAAGSFVPGDQARYTDLTIRGKSITVTVANRQTNVLYQSPTKIQEADALRPLMLSARTLTLTLMEVTFDERMRTVVPGDFRVDGTVPTSAQLLGDGTLGELVVAALGSPTPTVTTIASPTGSYDLGENLIQGELSVLATDATGSGGGGPIVPTVSANLIYPSAQDRNDNVHIGLNIVNPTSTSRLIESVKFSVAPTLGSSSSHKFFRTTLTNGPGSDLGCTWAGGNSDAITCTPASPVTLPALGVRQVVMTFRTSDRSADLQTVLTGTVTLTGPAATVVSNSINVRHASNDGNTFFVRLLPETSLGGDERGSPPSKAGGAAADFYFEWDRIASEGPLTTGFTIPAGWSSLSVPTGAGQGGIGQMSLAITQPTSTQPGRLVVSQEAGDRDFFFRVTPPAGAAVYTMGVEMTGQRGSSPYEGASNIWSFGVQIT